MSLSFQTTKPSQKRGKTKSTEDSEEPVPKRKRIMQLSDSESSSDEGMFAESLYYRQSQQFI